MIDVRNTTKFTHRRFFTLNTNPSTYVSVLRRLRASTRSGVGVVLVAAGGGGVGDVNCGSVV